MTPTVDAMRHLLMFLGMYGDLLPQVPDGWTGRHIDHRAGREHHHCVYCDRRASVAYVLGTGIGDRWLDLCARCDNAVRHMAMEDL